MRPPVESLNVAVAAGVDPLRSLSPAPPGPAAMTHPDLFDDPAGAPDRSRSPLAERMRPRTFDEYVGQQDLLAPGKPLREAIERDLLQSVILWGPPGTGKTSLARLIADTTKAYFIAFSAVLSGIREIRDVMAEAERARRASGPPHDPVRRRDPPLQQGPAGRLPAEGRVGRHRPHRRDDREPVVRGQRAPALAVPGVRPAASLRGRHGGHPAPGADRRGARVRRRCPSRSPTRRSGASRGSRTGTGASP